MRNIKKRVSDLEGLQGDGLKVFHRVFQEIDETKNQVIAAYNAANPIPAGENRAFIIRSIIDPEVSQRVADTKNPAICT